MGIIFDLDQTLVDSSLAEPHRGKNWSLAYKAIPNFTFYEGLDLVFEYISNHNIESCIVTSSTSYYCQLVTKHWQINCDFHICYHDTTKRKPSPDPINKAVEKMNCDPEKILSVGDRDIDIIASHAAGVKSVACLWGAEDPKALLAANPTHIARTPLELLAIIQQYYPPI